MEHPYARNYKTGILLRIAYDGQDFSGLAVQDNARTVAGVLQDSIYSMDPNASRLRVCSRTDAGVHAKEQYIAFNTNKDISSRGWVLGLSGEIPPQIAILSAARIPAGFEPSKNAVRKTYCYSVLQGTIRDPFHEGRTWRVFERLNHRKMADEAELLLGTHDFQAFRGRGDIRTQTVRTIEEVTVTVRPGEPRILDIHVTGNAFMYHMVRIISGTLVDVGRGKLSQGAVSRAIASGNRLDLGMTAPAAGLCLERIELTTDGTDQWPYHLDGAPIEPLKTP